MPPAIPIPADYDGKLLRAFVVVTDETQKVVQEYINPLLVLTGDEYASMTFDDLYSRICDALLQGRPRPIGEYIRSDGTILVIYDDGTSRKIPHPKG